MLPAVAAQVKLNHVTSPNLEQRWYASKLFSALATLLLASLGCTSAESDERKTPPNTTVAALETPDASPPGGGRNNDSSNAASEIADPSQSSETTGGFDRVDALEVGIDFRHRGSTKRGSLRANTVGCGLCMGDYDGDGHVDVYICDSTAGGALFKNLGGFRFENVTAPAGLTVPDRWSTGATFVDIDNDGDLDLYVCGYQAANRLYINNGDGTFADRAAEYGLAYNGSSTAMTFADYDNDGDLDAYLVTNHLPPKEEISYSLEMGPLGRPQVPEQYREYHELMALPNNEYGVVESGQYDHLYRNNGDGTFTDVTDAAGVKSNDKGLAATWWDFNQDNRPDLYVANDFYGADHLYRNNGDGTFDDVAAEVLPHTPWFSMGCDVGDINNDGWIDFIASDMAGTSHYREKMTSGDMEDDAWFLESAVPRQYMRNAVYLNTGVNQMMEAAYLTGLARSDWTWTVKLVDLDQDGLLDLYVTNGMNRDWENSDLHRAALKAGAADSEQYNEFWEGQPTLDERNLAFRNRGDLKFENVSDAWCLDLLGVSFGAAFGDLDNDGDLDLIVNNLDDGPAVYRNSASGSKAVRLRLVGVHSNRWGLGSRVECRTAQGWQAQYLTPVRGFMSGDDATVHFGLGNWASAERVVVTWPSGRRERFRDLAAGQLHSLTEGEGEVIDEGAAAPETPAMFRPSGRVTSAWHREKPFDDFAQQAMLPHRLSRLGPGITVGDVDGDGRDEIFKTGGKGIASQLLAANESGEFVIRDLLPPWGTDSQCEGLGALFFDADSDGDQDLFMVTGGVESAPDADEMRDRLYINDGAGNFAPAADGLLPDCRDSGGAIAAADYDRDGDLDLFIGGRCLPGRYPHAPTSRLLRNDAGTFTDVAANVAGLAHGGMATSAVWSDANGDGWVDLLATYEWGPVRLFLNQGGSLYEATTEAELAEGKGWWNSIVAGDIDGDGDMDYAVGNCGLNTRYEASAQRPAWIIHGDLEGLGREEVFEATTNTEGRLVPVRGKGTVEKVFALIAEKFPTYDAYAKASVEDMFGKDALDKAFRLSASELASGVLINDGKAHFVFLPLPRTAQLAPIHGASLADVDGDGRLDLFVVQNQYGAHREAGHMDGGLGLLLQGNGDGSFRPASPRDSGLVVPGDARSLARIDLDQDGTLDFLVGINDDVAMGFERTSHQRGRLFSVRLIGRPGTLTCVGAQITLTLDDNLTRTAEVFAGDGYLSQSSPAVEFGLGAKGVPKSLKIRWPDGKVTTHVIADGAKSIAIEQPAASEH
jgi:hypothetical protein